MAQKRASPCEDRPKKRQVPLFSFLGNGLVSLPMPQVEVAERELVLNATHHSWKRAS